MVECIPLEIGTKWGVKSSSVLIPEIKDATCSISEVCLWFINPYADRPSPHSDKSSFWFGSRPPPDVPLLESITIPSFSIIPCER